MNRKFISNSNYILRRIFEIEKNLDIVKDFIEAFLKIKISEIEFNSYKKFSSNKIPSNSNLGFVSVRIKGENNKENNIGIQFIDGFYIQTKLLLFSAQVHTNQLKDNYKRKIAKTITINILDFNIFKSSAYHKKLIINKKTTVKKLKECLEIHVIELQKFLSNSDNKQISKKEEWMIYLIGDDKAKIEQVMKKNEKIRKLDTLLNEYWNTEKVE